MDAEREKKMVFVTVGTTCFDALVKAVDTQQVKEELWAKGYTDLVIQMGRGLYIPSKISGEDGSVAVDYFTFCSSIANYLRSASLIISHAGDDYDYMFYRETLLNIGEPKSENVTGKNALRFQDPIQVYTRRTTPAIVSQLTSVSSPAQESSETVIAQLPGSGSIFESLRLGKPLIVVVNEDLMDNHQSELAEELADRKNLFYARPQTLHQTIKEMNLESLVTYLPGDAMPVVDLINRFLGFPSD